MSDIEEMSKNIHQYLLWQGYEAGNTLIREDRRPYLDTALHFLKSKYPEVDECVLRLAFVMGWDACECEKAAL